jgi:subtilisin family serine protease
LPERITVELSPEVALNMPRVWAIATGSRSVVVGLIDDGFFYTHEDVFPNVWRNPGETGRDHEGFAKETNEIDDDGDGYVDNVVGWDFAFNDPDPDPYVFDGTDATRIQPYWHSISALGIIGAKGDNGIGVAGINWDVSLMLLKTGAQGLGMDDYHPDHAKRVAEAIRYAADHGARVINWSGWVPDPRPDAAGLLRDAIRYAAERQVLLVLSAGNSASDLDREENCFLPRCLDEPNVINVTEVMPDASLRRYELERGTFGSNFGVRRVEIAAMARQFTTHLRHANSTYRLCGGTSCAAPVVSGVAALVLSVQPDLTALELKRILLDSATRVPELGGSISGGRVVNALAAIQMATQR